MIHFKIGYIYILMNKLEFLSFNCSKYSRMVRKLILKLKPCLSLM